MSNTPPPTPKEAAIGCAAILGLLAALIAFIYGCFWFLGSCLGALVGAFRYMAGF